MSLPQPTHSELPSLSSSEFSRIASECKKTAEHFELLAFRELTRSNYSNTLQLNNKQLMRTGYGQTFAYEITFREHHLDENEAPKGRQGNHTRYVMS